METQTTQPLVCYHVIDWPRNGWEALVINKKNLWGSWDSSNNDKCFKMFQRLRNTLKPMEQCCIMDEKLGITFASWMK
jgi:hypothetical protein